MHLYVSECAVSSAVLSSTPRHALAYLNHLLLSMLTLHFETAPQTLASDMDESIMF